MNALHQVKPSVSAKDLVKQEEWTRLFGSDGT
jgi:hypothetical protein